jgi:hypothetical protein
VHVRGTATVVHAAEAAGVDRIAYVSFLRARPGCGSPYELVEATALIGPLAKIRDDVESWRGSPVTRLLVPGSLDAIRDMAELVPEPFSPDKWHVA